MGKSKKKMREEIKGGTGSREQDEDKKTKKNNTPDDTSDEKRNGRQRENTGEYQGEADRPQTDQEEIAGDNLESILIEKIREQEDRYLRLAAEFDNYRKRTLREKAELTKVAGAEIIAGMLPVIDDLDRAVEAMAGTSDLKAMKKGIELIHGKFRDFLSQKGVKEIRAIGSEFDTDYHEAVTKIPAPAKKDRGKIVDVIEKGYLMNDRVIRYAKVVVGE
jgi:molecular chaperone GrpE